MIFSEPVGLAPEAGAPPESPPDFAPTPAQPLSRTAVAAAITNVERIVALPFGRSLVIKRSVPGPERRETLLDKTSTSKF